MRVAFYSHPAFFEPALHLVRELSPIVELHVLVEISPWSWHLAEFDIPPLDLPLGIVSADPVVRQHLSARAQDYLSRATSLHFVVHHERRSLTPASWLVSQRALQFLRELRPDVLHLDDPDESLRLAVGVPWRMRTPLVLSVHDPERHSGEADWHAHLARSLLFRRTERFVLHNRASQAEFCRRNNIPLSRTRSVPLGVYEPPVVLRATDQDDSGPVVLFFGRVSPYKGLAVLYAAAPLVAQRVPGVRFVVAGRPVPGYQLPPPPVLSDGATIEISTDYIHNDRLHQLLQSARVVVCPYLDATQSGVVLTSFAFRKPVVATRVGGLPEYVHDEESGLLVEPGNAPALADALVRVLQDAELRRRLRAGVDMLAQGPLSWRNSASQMLEVYQKAILSRTPQRTG